MKNSHSVIRVWPQKEANVLYIISCLVNRWKENVSTQCPYMGIYTYFVHTCEIYYRVFKTFDIKYSYWWHYSNDDNFFMPPQCHTIVTIISNYYLLPKWIIVYIMHLLFLTHCRVSNIASRIMIIRLLDQHVDTSRVNWIMCS